jgi:hypothetical protein
MVAAPSMRAFKQMPDCPSHAFDEQPAAASIASSAQQAILCGRIKFAP